jgi:hypothetical protein
MSYLNVPRLTFQGQFVADPSTINNLDANWKLGAAIPPEQQLWNPNGTGAWSFVACSVTRVTYQDGTSTIDANADAVIGSALTTPPGDPLGGKLVDLDPDQQGVSEIWGLQLDLGSGATNSLTSRFKVAAFMDLWSAGPGGQAGLRAFYQSVLEDLDWGPDLTSRFLQELERTSRAAGTGKLSIKFMLDRYNAHNPDPSLPRNFPDPGNGMPFTHGRIVGTIGPALAGEPDHFVAGRLLRPAASSAAVNFAPSVFDPVRSKLVLDLGNSIKAAHLVDQTMEDIGPLQLVIRTQDPQRTVSLGPIDYGATDPSWYPTTAGIVEFDVPDARIVEHNPLAVVAGVGGGGFKLLQLPQPLLQENPDGSFVRADTFVYRLSTDEPPPIVTFHATEFGKRIDGKRIQLSLVSGFGGNQPEEASGLSSTRVTETDPTVDGRATYTWNVSDPGNPRPDDLDGQVYFVGYGLEGATDRLPNSNFIVSAHLYCKHRDVASPTWVDDIKPIFAQYAQLYPVMGFLALSEYATFQRKGDEIRQAINRPLDHPMFMPVTRDLSPSRLALINRWFDLGMPERRSSA